MCFLKNTNLEDERMKAGENVHLKAPNPAVMIQVR